MSTIIPCPPPTWATRSAVEDGGIWHDWEIGSAPALPDGPDQLADVVRVTLTRTDVVDVLPAGLHVQPGASNVMIGDHRVPIESAATLAALLIRAVEAAGERGA